MAPKKKTAAEAQADMQEGKDVQEPQAVAEPDDTPAVAENAAVDEAALEDAPRLKIEELDVQPIAPVADDREATAVFAPLSLPDQAGDTDDSDAENTHVHNFSWAAQKIQDGFRVRREAWTGNKFLEARGYQKNVLTNEDMLAADWIVI